MYNRGFPSCGLGLQQISTGLFWLVLKQRLTAHRRPIFSHSKTQKCAKSEILALKVPCQWYKEHRSLIDHLWGGCVQTSGFVLRRAVKFLQFWRACVPCPLLQESVEKSQVKSAAFFWKYRSCISRNSLRLSFTSFFHLAWHQHNITSFLIMWHFCICSIKMPGMSLWAVLLLKHSLFSAVKPLTLVIHCAELVDLWQSMLHMNMWWRQRSYQRKANEHSPAQRTLVRLWVGGSCNIVMLMSVFDTKNVRDTREGGGETVSSHIHAEPFLVCDLQRTREHVEEDVRCPYPSLIWLRVIQASYIFGRESSQESYRCSSPFFRFAVFYTDSIPRLWSRHRFDCFWLV